jgi:hypothetical protein
MGRRRCSGSGISSHIGEATSVHRNGMLSVSCQQETCPTVLRNVLVRHVAGKPAHGRISYGMRATGEEGESQQGCQQRVGNRKQQPGAIVLTPPHFSVGKVRTSLSQRDANTHLHGLHPLGLTNQIASILRTHFQSQDDSLRSTHWGQTTRITSPLQYHKLRSILNHAPHTFPSAIGSHPFGNMSSLNRN